VYEEIIAICYEYYTSYINTLFGQDVEICNIAPDGKVHPETGHEGAGAEQSIAPLFNNLGGGWVVNTTPRLYNTRGACK